MADQPRERPPVPPWWEPYAQEFPWWQAWHGTGGLLYARKLETIPPVVVRADDPRRAARADHPGRGPMVDPSTQPPDPEPAFRPRPQPDQPARPPGRVRRDERDGCAAAEQLQAQRPQWMITYGCYSRRFWAWPKFAVTGRVIISAPFPDVLLPVWTRPNAPRNPYGAGCAPCFTRRQRSPLVPKVTAVSAPEA